MRVYLPIAGQPACPASMCPLFAKQGSPWTREKNVSCARHEDQPTRGAEGAARGCGFWREGSGCDGAMFALEQVAEVAAGGRTLQVGSVRMMRETIRPGSFDCPQAARCQWQVQSLPQLCPPRQAMAQGIDPRACAW